MADINVNPQILPSRKAVSAKEHNRVVTVAVWAAVAAVIVGGTYWWQTKEQLRIVPSEGQAPIDVLSVIRDSPVEVTPGDMSHSLDAINKSNVSVSDTERQAALQELQTRLNTK